MVTFIVTEVVGQIEAVVGIFKVSFMARNIINVRCLLAVMMMTVVTMNTRSTCRRICNNRF